MPGTVRTPEMVTQYVGKIGTIQPIATSPHPLTFKVEILDVRRNYGHVAVLVRSITGGAETAWVRANSIVLDA